MSLNSFERAPHHRLDRSHQVEFALLEKLVGQGLILDKAQNHLVQVRTISPVLIVVGESDLSVRLPVLEAERTGSNRLLVERQGAEIALERLPRHHRQLGRET